VGGELSRGRNWTGKKRGTLVGDLIEEMRNFDKN